MPFAIALLPLGIAVGWIVVLRRSSMGGAAAGLTTALILVALEPGYGLGTDQIWLGLLRGALVASIVAYVLFFGVLLARLMSGGGGEARLAGLLSHLPGDRAVRAMILAIPIGAFFESVSGFGVGVAVVGPLLAGLGLAPRQVGILALLSQNAVPWGAAAVGVVFSAALTGLPLIDISVGCTLLLALALPLYPLTALGVAGGRPALGRHGVLAVGIGAGMAAATYVGAQVAGTELAIVVGGPLVAIGAIAVTALTRGRPDDDLIASGWHAVRGATPALIPFATLVAVMLSSRAIEPLHRWLGDRAVVEVAPVAFRLPILQSAGTALAIACLVAVVTLRVPRATVVAQIGRSFALWTRSTVTLVCFTAMAELMLRSGMTTAIAETLANNLLGNYAIAAPILGGLSGFLTGSNAGGTAMLLSLQVQAAERAGLPILIVVAAQNAAASAFSMASPGRVVLAAALSGERDAEGSLMRFGAALCSAVLLLMIVAILLWLRLAA